MADAKPVFLSYARRSSEESARALHAELTDEVAFFDQANVDLLEEFPRRISDALLGSRVVVVFPDETYFQRWYCLREWRLAISPWEETRRRRGTVDVALTLGHLIVALPPGDFVTGDKLRLPPAVSRLNLPTVEDVGSLAALVRANVEGDEPTLAQRLEQLGVSKSRRNQLSEERILPLAPRRMGGVPCNTDKLRPSLREGFVGRADEMWQLHEMLSTQRKGGAEVAALTGALQGGGGFGKTRLAVEYARRLGPTDYPGGVLWVDASEPERLSGELRSVLRAILAPAQRGLADELPERDLYEAVRDRLVARAAEGDVLYVVDNLPEAAPDKSPPSPDAFCPALGEVTCLITSRSLLGYGGSVKTMSVDVLDEEAALDLLTHNFERGTLNDAEWEQVSRWTGRLPLALELLNGMLTGGGASPTELLEAANGEIADAVDVYVGALRGQVPDKDLRNTAQIFELSYDRLDGPSRDTARRLAWCAPDPIPQELLRDLIDVEPFEGVRAQLVGRSFLTSAHEEGPLARSFVLHRVLASFLRAQRDGTDERNAVFQALRSRFGSESLDDPTARSLLTSIVPHLDAQIDWVRESGVVDFLSHWRSVFEPLENLGQRSAEEAPLLLLIRLTRLFVKQASPHKEPRDWATSQVYLGRALQSLGEREGETVRLEEAVAAFRAALELRTKEALPREWAMTQNSLGNALQRLGEREGEAAKLEKAVEAYRAALEVRTKETLPIDWAGTQNNLGNALQSLGERAGEAARLEEAIAAYRAALEVRTEEALPVDWAMMTLPRFGGHRTYGDKSIGARSANRCWGEPRGAEPCEARA